MKIVQIQTILQEGCATLPCGRRETTILHEILKVTSLYITAVRSKDPASTYLVLRRFLNARHFQEPSQPKVKGLFQNNFLPTKTRLMIFFFTEFLPIISVVNLGQTYFLQKNACHCKFFFHLYVYLMYM